MSGPSNTLDHIGRILKCQSVVQVWQLHTERMRDYGFDRLLYGANQFRSSGEFGDISDWVILTNHDKNYVDVFFGKALFYHAPMAVWVTQNTGVCSWQWALDRRAAGECSEREIEVMDINEKMGVSAGYSISFEQISHRSAGGIGLCARRGLSQADVEEIWSEHGAQIEVENQLMNLKISSLPVERNNKPLTERQREVLQWVADGKTVMDVATIMGLNVATVEKHLRLARERLDAGTTAQAVLKAAQQNQFFIFEGIKNRAVGGSAQLTMASIG